MSEPGVDINQIARRWRDGALSELKPARDLLETDNPRQALFWIHLAVEKALKAHVVVQTRAYPPFTHSLPRLAELTRLEFSEVQYSLLDELNAYQVETRYGDTTMECLLSYDQEGTAELISSGEELVQWLAQKLSGL